MIQRDASWRCFSPAKSGNMDCTFCLDCVHACPHDNIGILSRLPASELMVDPRRSGIGHFSHRKDLAALAIVFTFGALLNAFGMVSPVYALESWLAGILHVNQRSAGARRDFRDVPGARAGGAIGTGCMGDANVWRQPADAGAAGSALHVRIGAARIWDVAGALRFSFFDGAVHSDAGNAERDCAIGLDTVRRAALDVDWDRR